MIMWLLPQHQHKSVNRDTATAFYTTSLTPSQLEKEKKKKSTLLASGNFTVVVVTLSNKKRGKQLN